MLTVIRQVFGLQKLRGERAVRVLVGLLVARLSVLPVAGSERSLLGGARRDPPPSALDDQHGERHEPQHRNHDETRRDEASGDKEEEKIKQKENRAGSSVPSVVLDVDKNPSRIQRLSSGSWWSVPRVTRRLIYPQITRICSVIIQASNPQGENPGAFSFLVADLRWFRPSVLQNIQ